MQRAIMKAAMNTGLVLSGGGFFGAFQAGVYEVTGQPDCVAGASAGALNAWAIASGMPPRTLQALWIEAAETARAGWRWPRFPGDGFLQSTRLEAILARLTAEWRPRIDLAVVVSQGWNCRPLLLRNEAISARTLLASCAVPLLLPAQRLDGVLSFDGGLRDVCPVWAARELGAGHIIAVNVWNHLPFWWPRRSPGAPPSPDVTRIDPPIPLAPLRRSALATPAEVARWIALGRDSAAAAFARQ
jgi:NTE family protein